MPTVLDDLVEALYAQAAGRPGVAALPIRTVTAPALVRQVLSDPAGYYKNYDFLTDLALGRLSCPGGKPWADRAALTQAWFRPRAAVSATAVHAIYARHLGQCLPVQGAALFELFVAAGIEVFSTMLGLDAPLPWDAALARQLRNDLVARQVIGLVGATPAALAAVQQRLHAGLAQVRQHWQAHAPTRQFIERLQADGAAIEGFDATQELLIGVLAASDTTASALLWAVEMLARHPQVLRRAQEAAWREHIVKEVLRLFPPVPLLTRISMRDQRLGDVQVARGEPIAVSLVGLHCNAAVWDSPLDFAPQRWAGAPPAAADWLPFSRGHRVCAGMRIAMTELCEALAILVTTTRLEADPNAPRMQLGLSLRPLSATRLSPLAAPPSHPSHRT